MGKERTQLILTMTTPLLTYISCFSQFSYSYASLTQSSVSHHRYRHSPLKKTRRDSQAKISTSCFLCRDTNVIPFPDRIAYPALNSTEEDRTCSTIAMEAIHIDEGSDVCKHYQFVGVTKCGCVSTPSTPTSFLSSSPSLSPVPTSIPMPTPPQTTSAGVSAALSQDKDIPRGDNSFWLGLPAGIGIGAIIVFIVFLAKRRTRNRSTDKEKVILKKNKPDGNRKYDMMVFVDDDIDVDQAVNNIETVLYDKGSNRINLEVAGSGSGNGSDFTNSSISTADSLFRMEDAFPLKVESGGKWLDVSK